MCEALPLCLGRSKLTLWSTTPLAPAMGALFPPLGWAGFLHTLIPLQYPIAPNSHLPFPPQVLFAHFRFGRAGAQPPCPFWHSFKDCTCSMPHRCSSPTCASGRPLLPPCHPQPHPHTLTLAPAPFTLTGALRPPLCPTSALGGPELTTLPLRLLSLQRLHLPGAIFAPDIILLRRLHNFPHRCSSPTCALGGQARTTLAPSGTASSTAPAPCHTGALCPPPVWAELSVYPPPPAPAHLRWGGVP